MSSLHLWCRSDSKAPIERDVVYWNQYVSDHDKKLGAVSLPAIVNDNEDYWKSRYLRWLSDVGGESCGTKTVCESLLLNSGFSYWWMTVPSEFSFSPTAIAYSTLRLWAIAQILVEKRVENLFVTGADSALKKTIFGLCTSIKVQVWFSPEDDVKSEILNERSLRSRISSASPPLVAGIGHLILSYIRYFALRRNRQIGDMNSGPSITMVDNFAHCRVSAAKRGRYESHFWGPLAQVLEEENVNVNWVHIDLRTNEIPTIRDARDIVSALNNGSQSSRHILVQDYLSLRVLAKTMVCFFHIRRTAGRSAQRIHWIEAESQVDVSPLVEKELTSDFRGIGAARNALWICLFDVVMKRLPPQQAGVYLMENQPFELALLNSWKQHQRVPIVGFIHGTVRKWDLRYALGQSRYHSSEEQMLPRPSLMGVNGPMAEEAMQANYFMPKYLVPVEALRFELISPRSRNAERLTASSCDALRVLVLGEYSREMSELQLNLLKELTHRLSRETVFTFRPHPGGTLGLDDIPQGVFISRNEKLVRDLEECELVIAGNVSNSALDAWLNGLPLLIQRQGLTLNGTPVPKNANVTFVVSANDVANAIESIKRGGNIAKSKMDSIFYIDSSLLRWRALLGSLDLVSPSD